MASDVTRLAGDVAGQAVDGTDLPAFGIASASIGTGRASHRGLDSAGGGSSDGSERGDDSGELHFGGDRRRGGAEATICGRWRIERRLVTALLVVVMSERW